MTSEEGLMELGIVAGHPLDGGSACEGGASGSGSMCRSVTTKVLLWERGEMLAVEPE